MPASSQDLVSFSLSFSTHLSGSQPLLDFLYKGKPHVPWWYLAQDSMDLICIFLSFSLQSSAFVPKYLVKLSWERIGKRCELSLWLGYQATYDQKSLFNALSSFKSEVVLSFFYHAPNMKTPTCIISSRDGSSLYENFYYYFAFFVLSFISWVKNSRYYSLGKRSDSVWDAWGAWCDHAYLS